MKLYNATLQAIAVQTGGARLRFERTVWPYLIGRTQDTATAVEVSMLLARLRPWLGARMDLLAMWIDESLHPHPWFDETATRAMTHWLCIHRKELAGRTLAIAFVSRHIWKRRDIERRICELELAHPIAIDVFANESSARDWLCAHGLRARCSGRTR